MLRYHLKLDKIDRLGYQLRCMPKKVYMTTHDEKYLTVSSKEVALLCQTAVNLKDASSDSNPMGGNNWQLLRLSCLVRMIKVVRKVKSIK